MNQDMIYKEFGRLLCNARKGAGLTQEDVSKRVGLSRTSITNIEKGRQHVSLHVLYLLANAIGISPSDLLPPKSSKTLDILKELGINNDLADKELNSLMDKDQGLEWLERVISSKKNMERDNG